MNGIENQKHSAVKIDSSFITKAAVYRPCRRGSERRQEEVGSGNNE
jgi:hypothetical protein